MFRFDNPIVGGTVLLIPAIQSPDYVPGESGWSITILGTAEFQDGTFRGVLMLAVGEAIEIEGSHFAPTGGIDAQIFGIPATGASGNSFLVLASPADNAQRAVIELAGESEDASVSPYIHVFGQDDLNDEYTLTLWVSGQVTTSPPGNPSGVEAPHLITLDAGWSAVSGYQAPKYQLLPDGNIQLMGNASAGSNQTASKTLNSSNPLPVGYRPATSKLFRSYNAQGNRGAVQLDPTGIITMLANAGSPAEFCEIDAILPLT